MKIYRIKTDSNNVQALNIIDGDKAKVQLPMFDCDSVINDWQPLDVYIHNPKTKPKNFYQLDLGTLVCDEYTLEICYSVFETCGEILPIQVERGPKLYMLNILKCMNGLNYDTTEWAYFKDGTRGRILKYSFHLDRLISASSIFKIPETAKTAMFTYSSSKDEENEFYTLYNKHNLTGLIFEELQSS